MSRKRNYKQTRRAVSLSGELHQAMKVHCERAGLSISGFAEMILRREMGMEEREAHLERSPMLREAHKASKESKSTVLEPASPPPPPKADSVITQGYEEGMDFPGEEGKPNPPEQDTTESTARRPGGPIQPMPEPVKVYFLEPEPEIDSADDPEPEQTASPPEAVPQPEEEPEEFDLKEAVLPDSLESLVESGVISEEKQVTVFLRDSEELAVEPASTPSDSPSKKPSDSEELERKAPQTLDLSHEEVQVPDEEQQFERESDPGEVVEPEPEDTRPVHALRTDRPSREFMTKGERERAERARRIAEREKARQEEEREQKEAENELSSRRSGNVFSF